MDVSMQKIVRKNDLRTSYGTMLHCCLLPYAYGKRKVNGSELFFFSTNKNGEAELSALKRKPRCDIKTVGLKHQTENAIGIMFGAESKHRVRTYTNTACRAEARTHFTTMCINPQGRWSFEEVIT